MRLILALLILTSCTDIEIQRGAELRQEQIDKITTESAKGDVINLLGSPSTKSSFGDDTWYYIHNQRQLNLFGTDEITNQEILAITFNADDLVKKVEVVDLSKAQEVDFSEDKTPTAGNELSILEQMLGNIGKFNKEGDAKTVGSGRGNVPGG
jgi:outer membrane protein assembly factor BamE (lipoprotein component of BamABCDE complex)